MSTTIRPGPQILYHRRVSRDWLPAALLACYALAFGWTALGGGLLVADDHPGQLYRLHHALTIGLAPWRLNPGWWAGYAELQYYPPGFAWLGALLHYASLGRASVEHIYQLLLWLVYLLPGATTYMLLRRVLGSGWLALPGAFVALTLSAGSRSGVEEGLRWGLVSARLAWGLLPLLGLALLRWVEGAPRPPFWAAPLLAAIIVTHPAHAPAAFVLVLLAAWTGPAPGGGRWRQAALVLSVGTGLSAVWLLPLLAHLRMALPLAWGDSSLGLLARFFLQTPSLIPIVGLYVVAQSRAVANPSAPAGQRWLLSLAPVVFALVVLDAAILAPLGLLWIPADRLVDGLLLALVLGAAMVMGWSRGVYWLMGAVAFIVLLGTGTGEPLVSIWPQSGEWQTYGRVTRVFKLDDLWTALRKAPPGRILFIRSAVPLDPRPEWWRLHSHIAALTPVETGRDILNGTFTHPSPIAGLLYTGSAANRPITLLVEQRDGVTLFGTPLKDLDTHTFNRLAERLRISAVVAHDEDQTRVAFLTKNPLFTSPQVIGRFNLFLARESKPLPAPAGAQQWQLAMPSHPGGWLQTGMAWSPLWRAESGGRALPVRRDELGLLEVEAPAGPPLTVRLEHRPGAAEYAGLLFTGLSAAALVAAWRRRRDRP